MAVSSSRGWGEPEITEITPLIWGVLLALCWHAYAMGAVSFQHNDSKQKTFFALYLCFATYVSWNIPGFEHLFVIALGVIAFSGIAVGLILAKTQRHVYKLHATALLAAFLMLSSIYLWCYPWWHFPWWGYDNILTDRDLLKVISKPAVLVPMLATFLAYAGAYWTLKRYLHLITCRRALLFFGISVIMVGLPFTTIYFHYDSGTKSVLYVVALVAAALMLFSVAVYIERMFIGPAARMRGIGLSMIVFLIVVIFLTNRYLI